MSAKKRKKKSQKGNNERNPVNEKEKNNDSIDVESRHSGVCNVGGLVQTFFHNSLSHFLSNFERLSFGGTRGKTVEPHQFSLPLSLPTKYHSYLFSHIFSIFFHPFSNQPNQTYSKIGGPWPHLVLSLVSMVVGYRLVVSFNSSIELMWVLSVVTRFELVWVVESILVVGACSNQCGLCCFDGTWFFQWCLGFSFGGWWLGLAFETMEVVLDREKGQRGRERTDL